MIVVGLHLKWYALYNRIPASEGCDVTCFAVSERAYTCGSVLQITGAVTTYLVILIQFQLSFTAPAQNMTVMVALQETLASTVITPELRP
jgi:hypothetical protein